MSAISSQQMPARGIGAVTLWVALFWGTPDIADGIIFWLMK